MPNIFECRKKSEGDGAAAIVKSLTVTQQPTKTVYMEGEPLNLTGLRASAVVEPFSGEVTGYITTTPADEQPVPAGISDILVKYGNAVASVPITVYSIEEIVVTTQPTTEYFVGDTLDLTGVAVTGYANSGTMSTDITELCTFSPTDGGMLATLGTQTVTVSYRNLTTTISVGVYQADTLTVTTLPIKIGYEPNGTLDLTGIVVTASVSGTSLSQEVTSQCTFNPPNGTILNEEKTYTITVTYNGLSTSFDVICSVLPVWDNRGLDYNSWDTIQQYAKAGRLESVASVGDTKSFIVNNRTFNAEIVSINDGTGDAGQWYPANTVDFISKELYSNVRFSSSNTHNGGFPASSLKTFLNNTLYSSIPQDLKDVIIEKSHSYNIDDNGTMSTDLTMLWIPTYYEIAGAVHAAAPGETGSNNKAYILTSWKKPTASASSYKWWLGSINNYSSNYFWYMDTDETFDWGGASGDYCAVPICFRIG